MALFNPSKAQREKLLSQTATKIQARELRRGDIIVPTRQSSVGYGITAVSIERPTRNGKVRIYVGRKDANGVASYQERWPRDDVYVYRVDLSLPEDESIGARR